MVREESEHKRDENHKEYAEKKEIWSKRDTVKSHSKKEVVLVDDLSLAQNNITKEENKIFSKMCCTF